MYEKVAVIGDRDLIFPLRTLGIKVYSPNTIEEAAGILKKLEDEGVALCFLHERYFNDLKEERETMEKKFCPVIAGFSDYRTVSDYLANMIREMAVKATGSDSLVKKRD
jgi:vacuolar-type H+-ATPase subunit F/Vma7